MDYISDDFEEVSYIRPRDPSIQNFNRNNLKRVRMNMQFSVNEELELSEPSSEEHKNSIEEDKVQIYLRVKPDTNDIQDYIIHENELIYKTSEQDSKNTKAKKTVYKKIVFSSIFRTGSKQVDIFNDIVKLKVFEFINGKDTSIFTYGTTGSGRTYTTVGTAEEPGLLIRALEYIFRTLPELPEISSVKPTPEGKIIKLTPNQARSELALKSGILKSQRAVDRLGNIKLYQAMQESLQTEPYAILEQLAEVSIGVWVSFAEIHNDTILDLLQSSVNSGNRRLRIGISNGKAYIADLTHVCVSNGVEAFQVYQYGIQKLKSMKGNMVACPNTIFTIKIAHSLSNRETKFISSFSICNLANSMDNSVIVLGKCIAALKNPQELSNQKSYIPYRDSKLTQLFHRACLGLQNFSLIVNINLSKKELKETQNMLNIPLLTKEIISESAVSEYLALKLEYHVKLDQHIIELATAIDESKRNYHELLENRSENYELEKHTLIQGYDEVLRDAKELFNMKKRNLVEKYEEIYQAEAHELKLKFKKKIEQRKKKEAKQEVQYLKKLHEKKEVELQNLRDQVSHLEQKLNEIKELRLGIDGNNKLIVDLEESIERQEMDSFISNEIQCDENVEKSLEQASSIYSNNELLGEFQESMEKYENDSLLCNEFKSKRNIERTSSIDANKVIIGLGESIDDSIISDEFESEGYIERSSEKMSNINPNKQIAESSEKHVMDSFFSEKDACERSIEEKNVNIDTELEGLIDKYVMDSIISDEIQCEENIDLESMPNFDLELEESVDNNVKDSFVSEDIECKQNMNKISQNKETKVQLEEPIEKHRMNWSFSDEIQFGGNIQDIMHKATNIDDSSKQNADLEESF